MLAHALFFLNPGEDVGLLSDGAVPLKFLCHPRVTVLVCNPCLLPWQPGVPGDLVPLLREWLTTPRGGSSNSSNRALVVTSWVHIGYTQAISTVHFYSCCINGLSPFSSPCSKMPGFFRGITPHQMDNDGKRETLRWARELFTTPWVPHSVFLPLTYPYCAPADSV